MASMKQDKKAEDDHDASEKTTCPVCLEPQYELKIVGRCQHSCCTMCLTRHVEKMKQSSEKFTCLTCQGECGLGWDGAGAAAQGTDSADTGKKEDFSVVKEDQTPKPNKFQIDVKCQICVHRGQNVLGLNLCVKCDHLYICEDCTEVHARNRATKDHVVVPLKNTEPVSDKPEICTRHNAPLTSYCCGCNEPACKICVHIDHCDHDIRKLNDYIEAKVEEVMKRFKEGEGELKGLKHYKNKLTRLQILASESDKQENMMKEIEDHAEKCIDQIIQWKEEMRADVKVNFNDSKKIKSDIAAEIKKVSENIEKLQQLLPVANQILTGMQTRTEYLTKLSSLHRDLMVTSLKTDGAAMYTERLGTIIGRNYTFIPAALPTIGKLEAEGIIPKEEFKPTSIYEHEMTADSEDKFIPCVANLGKKYAVAHPTTMGTPSNAINIYELPGTLKLTLKQNVGPVHDMSSTPDNKLAVLTDGNDGVSKCGVKVYDTDTGKLCSNTNIELRGSTPISLGVNFQNQYVILSDREGEKWITICNGDGDIEHEHTITEGKELENPSRVTCGFKFISFMGKRSVGVYEVKESGLVQKSIITFSGIFENASDISAFEMDHLFVVNVSLNKNIFLQRYYEENNQPNWKNEYTRVKYKVPQTKRQCRLAVKGRHIIMSSGRTINVYKY